MEPRTLENTPLAEITAAFNEAFSDYVIKLQFTEEGMAAKMKGEGISLSQSVGAFEGEKLVGFILHAVDLIDDVKTVYNAGTGVVPPFRGKGITTLLYQYALPMLQQQGIRHHILEVIDSNLTAKKVYDAVGFQTVRSLRAYRSTEPIHALTKADIRPIASVPSDAAFFSLAPAWQNSTASINRDPENHCLIGAFENGELVGYAAYVPASGRVKQCGVHAAQRRKGVGRALFQHMQQNSGGHPLVVTNLDNSNEAAARFLEALRFQKLLGLYEMCLQVE